MFSGFSFSFPRYTWNKEKNIVREAGDDADIIKFGGDSSESVYLPLKMPKSDSESESESESDPVVEPEKRILRRGDWDNPEYARQRQIFQDQFEKSEVIYPLILGFM